MQNEDLYGQIRKWKKIAISLTAFVVISAVSTVSFILGKQSARTNLRTVPVENSDRRLILGSETGNVNPVKVEATPTPKLDLTPTPVKPTQPIPSISSREIILPPQKDLEGFRSSNGSGSTSSNIRAGRDNELVTRAFISFDITVIPEDAEIISATIRLFQTKTLGNPYKSGGDLLIDHLDYGDSLDSTDFSTPALISGFEIFSEKSATGWREADVTDQLVNDLVSARPSTQYRLHFEKEVVGDDENGDFAYFESSENTQRSGNTPELVINYK
ncbi:DNRLRE domain-containing protein [Candidatus Woesebacteria bacterium]|nr:DNRLRE domain-containing protein [Candidatus Woesebacteria bacterium]